MKDTVGYYFKKEQKNLLIITITGIVYNVGMIAGPWFEGQLAQRLADIIMGEKTYIDMIRLAVIYVLVIALVQGMRFFKRFYVRRFGNNINREMKRTLYHSLVNKSKIQVAQESTGSMMTKAILDVDACSEGMRKFTTEVFDTGVVMIAYLVMLLAYDWRLTILSCIFPPFAYIFAEKLKVMIHKSNYAYKESAGRLNNATLERIKMEITFRVYGCETERNNNYENYLKDYEKNAIRANVWATALQPVYEVIAMLSVLFILWFGGKNVIGTGWTTWNIAAFTTFLSCFGKLALKSSKAAKLFNAVQKAQVSWKRIKPMLHSVADKKDQTKGNENELEVKNVNFSYPGGEPILKNINFTAKRGEIIGVAGKVASGKSTLGKLFLNEYPYEGDILLGGEKLTASQVSYMGHNPELLSDTIEENILLGEDLDCEKYISLACMKEDLKTMPEGTKTRIGDNGTRLSGGQQSRIAFARTLAHKKTVLILDDPFSAVDKETEKALFLHLKKEAKENIVIIISHRLELFGEFDKVLWIEDGNVTESVHEKLIKENKTYKSLFESQRGGLYEKD